MLFGTLVNRSARPLRCAPPTCACSTATASALSAAAAFAGGYNAGIALRGFGTEMFAAATPGAGDGAKVAIAPAPRSR